jgi:hypothetical protein
VTPSWLHSSRNPALANLDGPSFALDRALAMSPSVSLSERDGLDDLGVAGRESAIVVVGALSRLLALPCAERPPS